jgi:hypothetical protein
MLLQQIMCGIYAAITARGYTVQQQSSSTAFTQLKSYADDTDATHYSDNGSSGRSGSTSSSDSSSRAASPNRTNKLPLPLTVADTHRDMLLAAPYA